MSQVDGVPFALEAERAIVAALFGDRAQEAWDQVLLVVGAGDFYFESHKAVLTAFGMLVEAGRQPDSALLSERIKTLIEISDEVREALASAVAYPYVFERLPDYADLVREKAMGRRVAASLQSLQKKAGQVGGSITGDDLLRELDGVIQGERREARGTEILLPITEAAKAALERLERVSNGELVGQRTGITPLDNLLVGIEQTDLTVLAGRPSMGKTAMALSIARNIAVPADASQEPPLVPVFSLEMGREQLMFRVFSNVGSVDHGRLRRAALTDDDWSRLSFAVGRVAESGLRIDCDPVLTPSILRSKLRLLQRQCPGRKFGMVVVDYLQLVQSDRQYPNKATEVAEISRQLKLIAKEFEAPVLALSQLNRGVENRPNKRPLMSDLRESGGIEQDADIIIMLYRDDYYNPDSDMKGITECIVAKCRNGMTGTAPAAFRGEFQRFCDTEFAGYGES